VFFDYTDEQKALRSSIRGYLSEFQPVSKARALMGTELGYDPVSWRKIAADLGLQGIHLPERYGGAGGSYVELGIVFAELGRAMYCGPFLATVGLASAILLESGDEVAMAEYLPGVADGSLIATAGITEDTGSGLPGADSVTAAESAGGYVLRGELGYVLDGAIADLILVAAATGDGPGLFAVPSDTAGLQRSTLTTLDATRRFARLQFDSVPARLIGEVDDAERILAAGLDLARTALAAEQVGGAQACLEMATAYAQQREQFGRPIGSFQAIKHKCATMLVEVECATAAAQYAAWTAAGRRAELAVSTAVAKCSCSDAFFHAAAQNIQIHGGIGFTWEHDAHLYLKRAKSSQLLLGHPTFHREQLACAMGV
jgi:alkylation response protein AidB-like acyl-CoA dehydrogenase